MFECLKTSRQPETDDRDLFAMCLNKEGAAAHDLPSLSGKLRNPCEAGEASPPQKGRTGLSITSAKHGPRGLACCQWVFSHPGQAGRLA